MECTLLTGTGKESFEHKKSATFGMREVAQGRNHILLNGRPLHLRGTVENAVFPKTGHTPVCDAEWERIMRIVKDYGLNHIRFHSWCPPAAAFRMADRHGVYLEVEMPMWGKDAEPNEARYDFFRREMRAILKEYGNHPSFVLYCNGNEITGNFDFIEELTADGRKLDTRHLYSGSTARTRVPSDQYYVSQQTNKGPVKVYEGRPSTDWDRSSESDVDVPVISHESGQRCVYPDFREIGKYTGPVEARNFELWREMLHRQRHGRSGPRLLPGLGRADRRGVQGRDRGAAPLVQIGRIPAPVAQRLPGTGLRPGGCARSVLGLQGAGDARGLAGLLRADRGAAPLPEKRLVRRRDLHGKGRGLQLRRGGPQKCENPLVDHRRRRERPSPRGSEIADRRHRRRVPRRGVLAPLGKVRGPAEAHRASERRRDDRQQLGHLGLPAQPVADAVGREVLYTTEFGEQAKQYLAAGKKVVLTPAPNKVKGRKSTFHNHFWNPIMFAWAPMTIGCLIHADEPVFADFPTSYHTDWQWWDILENAKVIEMQETPRQLRPFIQVIDSFDNNEKLGIGFEARVGGGKLLVLAVDTKKKMDQRPATRQLLESIDRYVRSDRFAPEVTLDESFIASFMR